MGASQVSQGTSARLRRRRRLFTNAVTVAPPSTATVSQACLPWLLSAGSSYICGCDCYCMYRTCCDGVCVSLHTGYQWKYALSPPQPHRPPPLGCTDHHLSGAVGGRDQNAQKASLASSFAHLPQRWGPLDRTRRRRANGTERRRVALHAPGHW